MLLKKVRENWKDLIKTVVIIISIISIVFFSVMWGRSQVRSELLTADSYNRNCICLVHAYRRYNLRRFLSNDELIYVKQVMKLDCPEALKVIEEFESKV